MKPPKPTKIAALIITLLIALILELTGSNLTPSSPPRNLESGSKIEIERVIDGDTVKLTTGERIRLIGVDAPETTKPGKKPDHYGPEATRFLKRLLTKHEVRIEYDHQHFDKYGRTLAYLYLDDGTFVNREIIRLGYGRVYRKAKFKFMDEFIEVEMQAKEEKRGIWGKR